MRKHLWIVVVAMAGLAAMGCSPDKEGTKHVDLSAELAVVKEARAAYDAAWQTLQDLQSEQQTLKQRTRPTAEERARLSELETAIKDARAVHDDAFGADDEALTGFLNEALNKAPNNPATLQGLRLYADKAIRNANTFMTVSGDYRRAIEILETAASYYKEIGETVPEDLMRFTEQAKDLRFLSKERFDQIARGMSEDQVKAITGTPFFPNIREHESGGRKVITWFYNRADGEVAAVHFTGGKVYNTSWQVERRR